MKKYDVVAIIGPTASGKTALSIKLAKELDGEVINGDSMQIYKQLDIGTAKITEEEMEGVPHHLLSIKEPTESFSVAEYQKLVRAKIEEIQSRLRELKVVGRINVSGTVYPGTKVRIRDEMDQVKTEVKAVTFYLDKSFIRRGKYDQSQVTENVETLSGYK